MTIVHYNNNTVEVYISLSGSSHFKCGFYREEPPESYYADKKSYDDWFISNK